MSSIVDWNWATPVIAIEKAITNIPHATTYQTFEVCRSVI
jgi:hypothetical protein